MKTILEDLLALQRLQFDLRLRTKTPMTELEILRSKIPLPILAHYERLVLRGKKGVALARGGVCSECHLRITTAKLVALSSANDVYLCDNCGRYLYLPADQAVSQEIKPPTTPPPARRRLKSTTAHVH